MASKDSQVLPQKEAAVFKTIVVSAIATRLAPCLAPRRRCAASTSRAHAVRVRACVRACVR